MSGFREENIRVRVQAITELSSATDGLTELNNLIRQQIEVTQQAALSARTGSIQTVSAIDGVTQALKDQQKAQKQTDDEASASRKKAGTELDNLGKQVRNFQSLVAAAFTLNEIKTFGLDIIEAKTKIDSVKIALDTMIGSKKESAELYAQIVQLAKATPFSLEDLQTEVTRLKAYGVATSELIPTLTNLGNVASAVGIEKLPQITLAYGQIMNMGKLMGTEIRQLVDAGVDLYGLLATSMGKTKAEVQQMASAHTIMASDVKKAFELASSSGGQFEGMMEKLSTTVGGQISNLSDSFFVAKARIGDFFEKQIKGGTESLNDLMQATTGSNSAIARTVDIVKSAAAFMATLTVATKAQAVVDGVVTAYQATKNVLYGEYLLAMRAVTAQTVVFTAAEAEAVVAAEAFNVAISSNWIGLAATAIAGLVSAYYAYKAVNDEVTTSIGEQQIAVKAELSDIRALTEAVMSAASGTKERKDAIDLLVKKYPEYFSGLSDEKTSNEELKSILDKVNVSYMTRINLARQAYKLEGLQDEIKKNLKEEAEILAAFPADLQAKYGGDINKAVQDLFANPELFNRLKTDWTGQVDFNMTQAKLVADNLTRLGAQEAKTQQDIQATNEGLRGKEVEAIKTHYAILRDQAGGNSAEITKINADEKVALAKANGTYREREQKDSTTHAEKVKTITLVSANEISEIIKGADADTLKEKIAYLDAAEKVERDAVSKAVVSKTISTTEVKALEEKAQQDILDIHEKYEAKRTAVRQAAIDSVLKTTQSETDLEKQAAEAVASYDAIRVGTIKKNQEELQKAYQNTAKLREDLADATAKQEEASALSSYILAAKTEQDKHDVIVTLGKKTGDDLAVLELARLKDKAYEAGLDVERAEFTYGKDSENYRNAVDNKLNADKDYSVNATQLQTQLSDKLVKIWEQQEGRKKQLTEQAIQGMVQALNSFDQQTQTIRDASLSGLQTELAAELTAAGDNFAQRKQIIDNYDAHVQETLYSANALSKVTSFLSASLTAFQGFTTARTQIDQDYSLKVQAIETTKNLSIANGQTQSIADAIAADDTKAASSEKTQKTIVAGVSAAAGLVGTIIQQSLQLRIQNDQAEIDSATKVHDATIAMLDDKYTKEKANLDATTQAQLDASTIQYTNAKKSLDDQLANRLTTLTAARDQEIRDVEADYAAKEKKAGDDSAEIQRLEEEKNSKIKAINVKYDGEITAAKDQAGKDQTKLLKDYTDQQSTIAETGKNAQVTLQQQLTAAKKAADDEYDKKVRTLQSDQFEAQRSMAKASIAVSLIQGAAALFAINPILGIIGAVAAVGAGAYLYSQLNGIANPYTGSGSSGGGIGDGAGQDNPLAIDKDGKKIYGFNPDGTPIYQNVGSDQNGTNIPYEKQRWAQDKTTLASDKAELETLNNRDIPTYQNSYDRALDRGDPTEINETKANLDAKINRRNAILIEIPQLEEEIPRLEQAMRDKGIPFFLGSPFVELNGNPAGRDTIPARLNEGERVLPTDDNLAIGGKSLTNKQLVDKVRMYDKFLASMPETIRTQMIMPSAGPKMQLPAHLLNGGGQSTVDLSGVLNELRELRQVVAQKKEWTLNLDQGGIYTSLKTAMAKTDYHAKIQQQ
ncbi:tape measure protein [Spirosoma sp. HMF4905]|uniref:Tape measure protein n=1 Tax=Spirosoma arboris TaxID=2682092 RepID=A0A7K1S9M5_9BACT|nr:tape measure protein [Spirosoma arboris]MVM30471.1 tape measure protein [Spirosoma arboris]